MMKILVVAATQLEIEPFSKPDDLDILISGTGIPSTVYRLTKKLLENTYDLVIQVGIAGSFSKKIKDAEVVVVSQDTFADIGVEEDKKFRSIFMLGLDDENKFPFREGWLINPLEMESALPLKKVTPITINKLSDRKKQTTRLKKHFNAAIESMEGAAFHFVCLQQNVPFIQLRSISNKVGERDKSKWKMKEAIENLNLALKELIESIHK
jgi:futalosine hydrolase